jgi:hypothetical protein
MIRIYTCLLPLFFLLSCAPKINYLGNSFQPTNKVDVYVDESAISRDYTIVGKGYVRTYVYSVSESIQKKAVNKAKQKGADAVLFKDYFVPTSPQVTRNKKDSSGNLTVSITNPAPALSVTPEIVVLFLKYKD